MKRNTCVLEDRRMVRKKKVVCVGIGRQRNKENNNINNNKKHACGGCEWVDENNNINNNKRHVRGVCEWVDNMYIFIYITMIIV